MKRDTYLSIDMDFWYKYRGFTQAVKFFNSLDQLKIKPIVVKYHHELTKHVNETPNISRLVNMDFHSDIADIEICDNENFNEGTWINYVRMQENSEYVWRYPMNTCLGYFTGYCHGAERNNPFNKSEQGKFHWDRVLKVRGPIEPWEFNRIAAVGICMSPNWTHNKNEFFADFLMAKGYLNKTDRKLMINGCNDYSSKHEAKEFSELNKKLLY
jgi:hypothetical protein